MLPSEKDDGNIEYKRYIMININKNKYDYSDYELKELIPLLKKNIYNKKEEDVTIEDIDTFHSTLQNKRLTSNLRFNQLASQMRYRLNEGNGVAIYYIGINDDGSIYDLNNVEKTESIKNLRELVKYIDCRIDKLLFIDNYVKVIIKNKNFLKLKEKNILLLGDTESGKTTFLAYLIKNKLDNDYSKARLHILNHKHEIETGRTSSFTCEYVNFNENNFVFIDSPGWDGVNSISDLSNLNMKSSRKRNKLVLTFNFDLIIFFDKPNKIWHKKKFYEEYAKYLNVPTISVNLFDECSFINLKSPISQEQMLSYFNSLLKKEIVKFKTIHKKDTVISSEVDEVTNILEKMDNIFPEDKLSTFSSNEYKRKLKLLFNNKSNRMNKIEESDLLNITFINSYPHQDLGLILSGYLDCGMLKVNQKLYCYMDIKIDNNDSNSESQSIVNPLEVNVKSIYKDGNSVDYIESPSTITISIDCSDKYGKKLLEVYGDFSKLLRFKDIQVNFLSNFSYKPETKFKLVWLFYMKDNKILDLEKFVNKNNTIQIMVKNQLITLKKIIEDNIYHYEFINLSKHDTNRNKELFNIDNQNFIYEDLDSFGFGKIFVV